MLPAEPVVESMNITMPKTEEAVTKAVLEKRGYKLIVAMARGEVCEEDGACQCACFTGGGCCGSLGGGENI